ncbi:hypothetical protein [Sphingobacterium cellulitidis]|uniref:hypothetical protein n=1 Tax=Sphingobacterium cellulitidis TaxID=1768011 RepID=UPI000B940EB7|nr:hypothetical protein CHT99_08070 [Sphingobacterium cellulitidis]
MKTLYKSLFEIKLYHEFYQTEKSGNNIFELANQLDRLDFLFKKFQSFADHINDDIDFLTPESQEDIFKNNNLKLLPTYSGCKILVAVRAKKLPSGMTTYEPINPLSDNLLIPILIYKKSSKFNEVSNAKMNSFINAYYLFSNDATLSGNRNSPYLTADVSDFDAAKTYEQGEIAKFGSNDIRTFYSDFSDTKTWKPIAGQAYANENDRLLVPPNFIYNFLNANNITNATFKLKNSAGTLVQKIMVKSVNPMSKVQIVWDPKLIRMLPDDPYNDQLLYDLEVSNTTGYSQNHKIVFYKNESELRNSVGLILYKVKSNINGFKIIDASGKLISRKNQFNIIDPPTPIFEINIRSKSSFWRYVNNKSKALKTGLFPDLLNSTDGTLISKHPRPLTSNITLYQNPDSSFLYLPNPTSNSNCRIENNKIYSEIMVPESDLFPLEP